MCGKSVPLRKHPASFLVLLFCIHVIPSDGFSFNNCTIPYPFRHSGNPKVLCNRMGYRHVPIPLPNNTILLDLSFNSITSVLQGDFIRLSNLINLNLSDNRISEIQGNAFSSSRNLEELNLSNNKLKTVTVDMLTGLINLSRLSLDSNSIETIENRSFVSLFNLRFVNLTKNRLGHISRLDAVFRAPLLEELYLGNNDFTVFNSSDVPSTLHALKKFDISQNPLRMIKITENIFPSLESMDLSNCFYQGSLEWVVSDKAFLNTVKTLNLSKNYISQEQLGGIMQSFSSVTWIGLDHLKGSKVRQTLQEACSPQLRGLHFEENSLSVITNDIFRPCAFLNELHIRNNKISTMYRSSFEGLQNLTELRLQNNKLMQLNQTLQHLPKLQILDLHLNYFDNTQPVKCSDFANLTQLRVLYLYKNRIVRIKACLFKDLKNLDELAMDSNRLITVKKVFTFGPRNLRYLDLKKNKLSFIEKNAFKALRSLLVLNLADNQILNIHPRGFAGMMNLVELQLSSNKINRKTLNNSIFSNLGKLQKLNLNSNYLSYESHDELPNPPFVSLSELRLLLINSQRRGLQHMPSNFLKGLKHLQVFFSGNLNLEYLHYDTFSHTTNLNILDLSSNNFADRNALTAMLFHPIPGLSKLTLSQTHLQTLDFLMEANLSNLMTLQAGVNDLQLINRTVIQSLPQLKILNLQNNSFACECNNAWFIDWAIRNNDTQVVYLNRYRCRYPLSLSGSTLDTFDTESCNINYDNICFICSSSVTIFTLVVLFIYHFLKWQVVYAYYLFLAFLNDRKRRQTKNQPRFQFDAFISYNVREEPWVLEELVPNLEGQHGLKLCIHHRDFQPGKPIIDNIVDGIYNSRKTVCLITQNYLKSVWCSHEIQLASYRLFDEKKDVLILVFLEDIPIHQLSPYYRMRKLVKKQTYLQWPKPGTDTRPFWQKLKLAIETKETMEEETQILSGQDKGHF
ncbi:uncharacterized protein [Misgurnus anguillicaudatus]|uniref:uncharacterized protein n=1 Tax=Misgurnus anguillicaudatus TaxID=75329 RepID=UPI003CCFD1EA